MKKATFLAVASLALTVLCGGVAHAQDELPSRIEVGIQFSSITFPGQTSPGAVTVTRGSTEAGFGGRITFNLNKNISLEAEGNFFPHENFDDQSRGGNLWQGQFGVKAGKRFGKFGVFGKARPGFASFSQDRHGGRHYNDIRFQRTALYVPGFWTETADSLRHGRWRRH